eukprot:4810805-Pleurochrysis_carterae.AAC.1
MEVDAQVNAGMGQASGNADASDRQAALQIAVLMIAAATMMPMTRALQERSEAATRALMMLARLCGASTRAGSVLQ